MTDLTDPAYRYVVVRAAADLPEGFLPPGMEGRWFNLDEIAHGLGLGTAVAVPTGRFERRQDGATARVYEFHL